MKEELKDKINARLKYLQHDDENIAFITEKCEIMFKNLDINIKHSVLTGKNIEEFEKLISSTIKFRDEVMYNLLVDEAFSRYEDFLKKHIMHLQDTHDDLLKTKSYLENKQQSANHK